MKTIYHGSTEIIKKPLREKGKLYNDYGQGFYCTENIDLAREWACTEDNDGYANQYLLDMNDLNVLDLSSNEYSILHWLAMLMKYRVVRFSTPIMKRSSQWLLQHYLPDISGADVIIGYRADDSYFSFARAFVNNEITLDQLSYAMKLGNLGEQIVLKSDKAFERIQFQEAHFVDKREYYIKRVTRDAEARTAYLKELEQEDIEGTYIRDLMRVGGAPL